MHGLRWRSVVTSEDPMRTGALIAGNILQVVSELDMVDDAR
jgi:hypothetical protein